MGNVSNLDDWLVNNGCLLETWTSAPNSPPQFLMNCSSLAAFQKFITDYKTAYDPVFVFKRNSGVGEYTYNTLGGINLWGMSITIKDSAEAPGVIVKRGILEKICMWILRI